MSSSRTRRAFLRDSAGYVAGGLAVGNLAAVPAAAEKTSRRTLSVAAVVTEYRNNSHADVIIGKLLEGYAQDRGPGPDLRVVSMFTDQVPKNDMSRALSRKHGFPIFKTIEDAITVGGNEIAVDGVLLIGEHGQYPLTPDTGQRMFPRKRFFDKTVRTFRRYGKVVPVFSDKHLAYNWKDAKAMYDIARKMDIPLMAGSSLPLTWRNPPLELPRGYRVEQALVLGFGDTESYGFHALETLQCMVERRRGGETGVASVQALRGDAIWKAEREGRWPRGLLEAALAKAPNVKRGKPEELLQKDSPFFLIQYRDGMKATVAMVNGLCGEFGFAAKLHGQREPVATLFDLQKSKPFLHFAKLVKAIEHMIHTGRPAYPVERTLLTTGILDVAMHSLADNYRQLPTPQLAVQYQPVDWPFGKGLAPPPRS